MDLLDALSMDPKDVKAEKEEAMRLRRLEDQKGVFGIILNSEAPTVLCDCMSYLREHGLDTEGLFRIPGNTDLVVDIKRRYEEYYEEGRGKVKRDVLNAKDVSSFLAVHDVATLMKAYFRDLAEPLIPVKSHELFIDALVNSKSQEEKMGKYSAIIKDMIAPNRECFSFLVSFLREVALFENVNKMNHVNLSTCFAPSLTRTPEGISGPESLVDLQMSIQIICDILTYIGPDSLYMPSKVTVDENTQYKGAQAPAPPPRKRGQTRVGKAPPGMQRERGHEKPGKKPPQLPERARLPPGLDTRNPSIPHTTRPLPPQPPGLRKEEN